MSKKKARLRTSGTSIDNYGLLIGSKSVLEYWVMVINNTRNFDRIRVSICQPF